MELNKFEFSINVKGSRTGKEYIGDFEYTIPTIEKKMYIDAEFKKLNSKCEELFKEIEEFNNIIATLKYSITKCPDWFKDSYYGKDLQDEEPYYIILNEITKILDKDE